MGEKILMKGNEAIGEAAIRAGCLKYFAYPITPQSEVAEYLSKRLPEVGGILPSRADYFQATKGGGHGDYKLLVQDVHTVLPTGL